MKDLKLPKSRYPSTFVPLKASDIGNPPADGVQTARGNSSRHKQQQQVVAGKRPSSANGRTPHGKAITAYQQQQQQ